MSTPGGFEDLGIAMRMRDTIARLVREEVDRYRPASKYGRVISANRTALNALVLLNGDTEPIKVKMSSLMQPLETDELNGQFFGCMVRVTGQTGGYWIDQIVSGHAYSDGQALASPKLYGGATGNLDIATFRVVEAALPALNSVYHVGRWDNFASNLEDGRGFINIHVRQDLFAGIYKTYEVSLNPNATNGVWQKLASSTDHGTAGGHDFEMEIMGDTTGFELRVRRTKDGGGFTPGGYTVAVWAYMDGIAYIADNVGESAAAVPTRMFATTVVGDDNGPYLSYGLNYNNRAQFNLMGGGNAQMNFVSDIFSWTEGFRLTGQSRNHYSPSGFYTIDQPANGTAIPVYGSALATTVNATAAGVPLLNNQTLYYEVPYGDLTTSTVATNFRIVAHDDATKIFTVPSHWVMIAERADSLLVSGICKLGTGQILNGIGSILFKQRTTTQTVVSSTTLVDDNALFVTVVAGGIYELKALLKYNSSTTSDLKIQWVGPASSTLSWTVIGLIAGAVSQQDVQMLPSAISTPETLGVASAGATTFADITGNLNVGSAGTFKLQWAQQVSGGTNTNMLADSYIRLLRMG